MGPNEVDIKDLQSLPNASEKDGAAPAIQKYAEPPKAQVCSLCHYCSIYQLECNSVIGDLQNLLCTDVSCNLIGHHSYNITAG